MRRTTASQQRTARERLASSAGYQELPAVNTALSFDLPAFASPLSRVVSIAGRSWEAWTPNAAIHAFYPGLTELDLLDEDPLPLQRRRADGHLGRFDPTRWPQVFRHDRLCYAFIRPESEAPLDAYPEFTPFHMAWDDSTHTFAPEFLAALARRVAAIRSGVDYCPGFATTHPALWSARPTRPTAADVSTLGGSQAYDVALDAYTRFQRQAKLASAWAKMAQAMVGVPPSKIFQLPLQPAIPAYMGAWVNGATMQDVYWLLQVRVPCYILHEIESYEVQDWALGTGIGHSLNFIVGTPAQVWLDSAGIADLAMERQGWRLLSTLEEGATALEDAVSTWVDRCRSSSLAQGWFKGRYTCPRIYRAPIREEDGRILPPPVFSTAGLAGRWTHWEQGSKEDGVMQMVCKGRGQGSDAMGWTFYDRENRRALTFDSRVSCPRHYLAPIRPFGLPAPDIAYVEQLGWGAFRRMHPSAWMYHDPDSAITDRGRRYEPGVDVRTSGEQAATVDIGDLGEEDIHPTTASRGRSSTLNARGNLSRCSPPSESGMSGPTLSPRFDRQVASQQYADRGRSASPAARAPRRFTSSPRRAHADHRDHPPQHRHAASPAQNWSTLRRYVSHRRPRSRSRSLDRTSMFYSDEASSSRRRRSPSRVGEGRSPPRYRRRT